MCKFYKIIKNETFIKMNLNKIIKIIILIVILS